MGSIVGVCTTLGASAITPMKLLPQPYTLPSNVTAMPAWVAVAPPWMELTERKGGWGGDKSS